MLRLKILREEKGISQQALALKFAISQSTISFYETGERSPDIETLIRFAEFFNVSTDYLVGYSDIAKIENTNDLTSLENNILYELKQISINEQLQVEAFLKGLSSK